VVQVALKYYDEVSQDRLHTLGGDSFETQDCLLKDGKEIFQMNIKPSKKSKLGDSDIMLDAGKGM